MKRSFVILVLSLNAFLPLIAQENDFDFGTITMRELEETYSIDTTASALYLREFGEAYISDETYQLNFVYHAIIKILKPDGVDLANIEIFLRKRGSSIETLKALRASSFNIENAAIKEAPINGSNIFTEHLSKQLDIKKIAIPNVRVGSVIEIAYTIESPFIYNFREWQFQGLYPKKHSEYWATIPANYVYNISLTGFLKLSKSENEVKPYCIENYTGGSASCSRMKYAMEDIPAFHEEDYMTAASDYMAAIKFELTEVTHFHWRTEKITKTWSDIEEVLREDQDFGIQLKRGASILGPHIDTLIAGEQDPLAKAKLIYDYVKGKYRWDEVHGAFCELGIKRSFEQRKGNVADINLSLIVALRHAGFEAYPVLLSTRDNGLISSFYPVLSDFNYAIARVKVGSNYHLLDATEDVYPFGLLPERCLNGRGRALGPDSSQWVPLNAAQRNKHVTMLKMNLDDQGIIHGSITTNYSGYAAVGVREEVAEFANEQEYFKDLLNDLVGYEIGKTSIENLKNITIPLVQNIEFTYNAFEGGQSTCLFNPFPIEKWTQNPFRSTERLYPVDFGAPLEEVFMIEFTYPPDVEVSSFPEKTAVALPGNGGRLIVDPKPGENKLSLSVFLSITKPVFTSDEYHYLKEIFSKVVQVQQTDLLIQRRK